MKITTAGESHGKGLFAIIEGLPSLLPVNTEEINAYLALRQSGYGRGGRQKIETDRVEILSGVRNGKTLGSPVTLAVFNRDYENWQAYMAPEGCDESARTLTHVRFNGIKKVCAKRRAQYFRTRFRAGNGDPRGGGNGLPRAFAGIGNRSFGLCARSVRYFRRWELFL